MDKELFERALKIATNERLAFAELILASLEHEDNEVQTDLSRRNGVKTEYDMVPAHTWFSQDNKCPDDLYFYEHSVVMKRARKITYTKEDYSMRVLSGKK